MASTIAAAPVRSAGPSLRVRLYATLGVSGLISLVVIVIIASAAAFAPWVAPYDPQTTDLTSVFASPSPSHPLGTDALGRDLLSRLIWGGRTTFIGPLLVIIVSTIIGSALGITSAWVGGHVDNVIARFLDVMFALPGIVFALVAVAIY